MRWRFTAAFCLAVLALAASSALVTAPQAAAPAPFRSSIKDLMNSIVDPSADAIWNAVGTVVDKDAGVIEMSPKTPQDWLDMRHASIRLIEGANLLMMPGRAAAPAGTKSDTPGVELEPPQIAALINGNRRSFDGFAEALQRLAVEALQATDAKDAALLMDVGGRMEDVCESCHQTFWYPQQKLP